MISPFADPDYKPEQFYYTQAIADHAVRFVTEHAQKQAEKLFKTAAGRASCARRLAVRALLCRRFGPFLVGHFR